MDRFDLKKMVSIQAEKVAKVDLFQSKQMLCGLNCFAPGQVQKVHAHGGADKLYYVVEGSGDFEVGEEKKELRKGELLYVPEDVPHGVVNTGQGNLVVLIVIAPNPLS